MRTWFPAASVLVVAVCFTLVGCGEVDPPYSNLVKYLLRTDPVVLTEKLGDETFVPDRPGQLPLFSMKDMLEPLHPLYPKKDKWEQEALLRDPLKVPQELRDQLEDGLNQIFGTPANPSVRFIDEKQTTDLKLDSRTLERGSLIYRVQCLHCHGVPGDGRGPTARWINPHPRDYRQGLFKFQSVDQTDAPRPPRRADLHRVIKYGIEATAMPSFVLLGDNDIDLLVSYVIHLSIRGKVEYEAFKNNYDWDSGKWSRELGTTKDGKPGFMTQMTQIVANDWAESQQREIKIAPYPYKEGDSPEAKKDMADSVARGQTMFTGIGEKGKIANCVNCHTDYGRQSKFRFDSWGTLVRPNNLTNGIYRGGRRTVDIYYRVHSGINGSGMASFGKQLESKDLWDLVNFVQTLPYPSMRKERGIQID